MICNVNMSIGTEEVINMESTVFMHTADDVLAEMGIHFETEIMRQMDDLQEQINGMQEQIEGLQMEAGEQTVIDNVGWVFGIAKSYLDIAYDLADQLKYKEQVGMYMPQITDSDGVKSISCSQFIQACISAKDYQHSRYLDHIDDYDDDYDEDFGIWSDMISSSNTYGDYMTAAEMANYFENRGLLKPIDRFSTDMKAGDLLLFEKYDAKWGRRRFYHVAICVGSNVSGVFFLHASDYTDNVTGMKYPYGKPRIADSKESGIWMDYKAYSSEWCPTHYVSAQDVFPIGSYQNKKIMEDDVDRTNFYSSATAYVALYKYLTDPLERGLYTIEVDDRGDNKNTYVNVYYCKEDGSIPTEEEVNQYRETIEMARYGDINTMTFYAQLPIYQIEIRTAGGSSYDVRRVALYGGYKALEIY